MCISRPLPLAFIKKGRTSSLRNLARSDLGFGIKPNFLSFQGVVEGFFTETDNFKPLALEWLARFPFDHNLENR